MSTTAVIVGLGSNQNPMVHMRTAIGLLKKKYNLKKISNIYESDAQILPDSPNDWNQKYLNAAVLIYIENFDPDQFLAELKLIEKKMGRTDSKRWAPRPIDLDILYVPGFKIISDMLNIPHQNLSERPFALLPALEVFPDIQIEKPNWCNTWVLQAPFNTVKSKNYFWPQFVGILNLTTDSFSDGNQYLSEENFKNQALKLINEGAEILDLGAESTRPQAVAVSLEIEFQRLNQALGWLTELNSEIKISIDCRNPDVVDKIFQKYKIHFLNDVGGFKKTHMIQILKSTDANAVVMHSLSIPPNQTETLNIYDNPNHQLMTWWKNKLQIFEENNIDLDRIIFDPGIGFGKTPQQNSYILNHLDELSEITQNIYLGFSRKSYLNQFTNITAQNRDLATAIQLTQINPLHCQFLRTHDIESQKTALRMM